MKKKLFLILLLVGALLLASLAAADTVSNSEARKGLDVREVSLHKFNTKTDKLGGRVKNKTTLSKELRGGWDSLAPYIKISNKRNYTITADLSLRLTFPDNTTQTYYWRSTSIGGKYTYWYWLPGAITEPGTYVANWYIDDVFLIERTFVLK